MGLQLAARQIALCGPQPRAVRELAHNIECGPLPQQSLAAHAFRSSNSYILILSRLFIPSIFHKAVPTQDVTNTFSLPSFYFMKDVPFFVDIML
jgi:hypothetical protein